MPHLRVVSGYIQARGRSNEAPHRQKWCLEGFTDRDSIVVITQGHAQRATGEGIGTALLAANLSAASAFTVTVAYATSNGSAAAGSDYTSASGTLTFAPGVSSKTVSVPILNDSAAESSETINLTLSSPSNATLGTPSSATLTILGDETPVSVAIRFNSVTKPQSFSPVATCTICEKAV